MEIVTHCRGCGYELRKPLRWFARRAEVRCPLCNGEFDRKPFEPILENALRRISAGLAIIHSDLTRQRERSGSELGDSRPS